MESPGLTPEATVAPSPAFLEPSMGRPSPRRVCVVGSGTRFISGISYYTNRLGNALAERHSVSVILMRQLLPTRLYPGRDRVGAPIADLRYPGGTRVFDGVDWFWIPSLLRALAFLVRGRPEVVVLEWWTGTVLHTYLALALVARLTGAKIVIEYHEVLDTGELNIPVARWYAGLVGSLVVRLAHGSVVHSTFDRVALAERYGVDDRPVALAPHGPYDQPAVESPVDTGDDGVCRLLYFGVIRPYKGVEDLVTAFDAIPEDEIGGYRLTIVGETWEGWTLPEELIERSRYRDRISFVNRYVTDEEVGSFFAAADAVVLPYHRSSSSGPLHIAMAQGLPTVVTSVGGLVEAAAGYEGAISVPPRDPERLSSALREVSELKGRRFADPHSWGATVDRFDELFAALLDDTPVAR